MQKQRQDIENKETTYRLARCRRGRAQTLYPCPYIFLCVRHRLPSLLIFTGPFSFVVVFFLFFFFFFFLFFLLLLLLHFSMPLLLFLLFLPHMLLFVCYRSSTLFAFRRLSFLTVFESCALFPPPSSSFLPFFWPTFLVGWVTLFCPFKIHLLLIKIMFRTRVPRALSWVHWVLFLNINNIINTIFNI